MRRVLGGVVCLTVLAGPALAQAPAGQDQKASIEELLRRMDALQNRVATDDELIKALRHRVEELEAHEREVNARAAAAQPETTAPTAAQKPPVAAAAPSPPPAAASAAVAAQPKAAVLPALLEPEAMGEQWGGEGGDALRSDLPGLSLRIPATESEVRLYGFANVNPYRDFSGRNQSDAPSVQTIPLGDSPAAMQGGDFGMSARFSRVGVDTRTAIPWGTLETRLEGDFGGGAPVATNAVFRMRQAWAEVGTRDLRVLIGQANSLWTEGVYETVNFAVNLNQSFVRQSQIRLTGALAEGLTGQVSLETPDTQYTSVGGVFTQNSSPAGFPGPSPAFTSWPDLLGRLDYRRDGLVTDLRVLLRELSIRTEGTAAAPPALTRNAAGWGVAGMARFPMRWLSEGLGPDELIGMGYYGRGIGRYFGGNTAGQDAMSDIGLPGVTAFSLDPLPTYGGTVSYRRFWTPQLRSNFVYSYAWQQYPSYGMLFVPGTAAATSLNSTMEQAIFNLIWSPFAELRGNSVGLGWLDVSLEYVYSRRDVLGGAAATSVAASGTGNRVYGAVTARF
jgi:hypothetical protein